MKRTFLAFLIAPLVLLTGCSTTAISPDEATSVTPMNFGTQTESENSRIVFVRDSGMLGCAVPIICLLNGAPAVSLYSSEKSTIFVKPDQYAISCQGGGAQASTIFLRAEPNSEIILRTGFYDMQTRLYQAAKDGKYFSTDITTKPLK